jgi:diguanylate cyclase (GGDEF)-like protein
MNNGPSKSSTNPRFVHELSHDAERSPVLASGLSALIGRVCRELAAATDADGLVQAAVACLRTDLSHPGASILEGDHRAHPQSLGHETTELLNGETGIAVPVWFGNEVFATIVIPRQDNHHPLRKTEAEILEIFSTFLAVCLNNVRRLHILQTLASTDALTGVMNRRRFVEIGRQALEETKTTCLILFDVDQFKKINDSGGHLLGDTVLRAVAERASEVIRKTDSLARYGGDEFVILLPDTDVQSALEIAERVRDAVQNLSVEVNGQYVSCSVSAGIANMSGDTDLYRLLRRADEALYSAKNAGGNLVRY